MTAVAVREIHGRDRDEWAYVLATWPLASRGSGLCQRMPAQEWRRVHVPLLRRAAERSCILLATPDGSPDVFCGFAVGEPEQHVLHYVYTRDVYRQLGIATQLLAALRQRSHERAPLRARGERWRMTHLPSGSLGRDAWRKVLQWLTAQRYVYSPHALFDAQEELAA